MQLHMRTWVIFMRAMITDLFDGSKAAAKPSASAPATKPVVATSEPAKIAEVKPTEIQKTVEKAKPVDVKKAEPTASANSVTMDNQESAILSSVNQWAKAWSAQDVNQYLGSYASTFDPRGGQTRKTWENARRQRVSAPKGINVEVGNPKVTIKNDSEAKVVFYQTYAADGKKSQSTNKTLIMKKEGNVWLINEELIGAH
jgi:murein L,D-transpeptidase YafK